LKYTDPDGLRPAFHDGLSLDDFCVADEISVGGGSQAMIVVAGTGMPATQAMGGGTGLFSILLSPLVDFFNGLFSKKGNEPELESQASGAGALKGNGKSQKRHKVPYNNTFSFQEHALVKGAGVDLKTYSNNIVSLINHAGRHTITYNQKIRIILDAYYEAVKGQDQDVMKDALDQALIEIESGIENGSIRPYDSKEVIIE
jgi:hypothetical protein